jgi:hypothetical protein
VTDVSEALGVPAQQVTDVEAGKLRPDAIEGQEATIARWIRLLDADEGQAVEALRRSMLTVPRQFGGPSDQTSANEFVDRVQAELRRLREQG